MKGEGPVKDVVSWVENLKRDPRAKWAGMALITITLAGLPFVYAFWAGRPGALGAADVALLREVKAAGASHPDAVAREYFGADTASVAEGARYLRENVRFDLGEAERQGLLRFYAYAAELGLVPGGAALRFY